ncbi:MAG: hypothetical protein J6X95_06060 [Treponema sp.]|nr:hypothetical protein [Treponema sp.]
MALPMIFARFFLDFLEGRSYIFNKGVWLASIKSAKRGAIPPVASQRDERTFLERSSSGQAPEPRLAANIVRGALLNLLRRLLMEPTFFFVLRFA